MARAGEPAFPHLHDPTTNGVKVAMEESVDMIERSKIWNELCFQLPLETACNSHNSDLSYPHNEYHVKHTD